MNAAVDVTRLCRRLIPILLVCCLAPAVTLAEEGRKVVFRLLCLEHREGITSARVDVGVKPGKFHEIILLTGNFTDDYAISCADNTVRFHVVDAARPDGRRIVAAGPLAAGERQLFLLLPAPSGPIPYRVFAMNDDETAFPMGATRALNLCATPVRFNLAGADMKPIEPGGIVVYPPVQRFDEWGMYQARIDYADAKGDWVAVSSPSWKASTRKRDMVITMMDPESHNPRIAYYKDVPPWRKPKLGLDKPADHTP